jgi:hypothetical protein
MTYRMQQKADCGPAAQWAAACAARPDLFGPNGRICKTYADWLELWGWPADEGWKDNANDSPAAHETMLRNGGAPFRWVTAADILACRCPAERTVILLHFGNTEWERTVKQHWVTLHFVEQGPSGPRVGVNMGNGAVAWFGPEAFQQAYRGGAPTNSAYVVMNQDEIAALERSREAPVGKRSRWGFISRLWDGAMEWLTRARKR